jgi:hypothetical protein
VIESAEKGLGGVLEGTTPIGMLEEGFKIVVRAGYKSGGTGKRKVKDTGLLMGQDVRECTAAKLGWVWDYVWTMDELHTSLRCYRVASANQLACATRGWERCRTFPAAARYFFYVFRDLFVPLALAVRLSYH